MTTRKKHLHRKHDLESTISLVFLGTGAAEGVPVLGCSCSNCQAAKKSLRSRRRRASLLVQTDRLNVLIDVPLEIREQLSRQDTPKIDVILITHWHIEHWIGLVELQHWDRELTRGRRETFEVFMNKNAYNEFETILGPLLRTCSPLLKEVIRAEKIEEYKPFVRDTVKIIPVGLYHEMPSTGYIINAEGKKISYLLDTGEDIPQETLRLAQGSDVVVLDCNFEKRLSEYHLSTMGVRKLVDKIEPKMTYLSHISHRNLPHEELEDFFVKSGANIMPAYDGLRVQI